MSEEFNPLTDLEQTEDSAQYLQDTLLNAAEETDEELIERTKYNPYTYVYDKMFNCPLCFIHFAASVGRHSKTRIIKIDTDLCPHYEPFNPMYYGIISCPNCGYTAMISTFEYHLTDIQMLTLSEQIPKLCPPKKYDQVRTISDAIELYKAALLCSLLKKGGDAEKAILCLKLSWLMREGNFPSEELDFAKQARNTFMKVYRNLNFPVFGMDEYTLAYLIGELSRRIGDYEKALQYLEVVIRDKKTPVRLRPRAEDVYHMIKTAMQSKQQFE
ncbi:MAG: DUF2225 domain-containing protein [Clostridiales bacterium]|nr:DUF2225 domain-containing protein [Clostridiales bacterium]